MAIVQHIRPAPEIVAHCLLKSPEVTIKDTRCRGTCKYESPEESTTTTQLVFPYRGVFVRRVGQNHTVAEANQVLFFNRNEGYRISHPISGGDACITLAISEQQLLELSPKNLLNDGSGLTFRCPRLRIDARTQALVALLRYSLRGNIAEPLEAESLAFTVVQRILGPRTTHVERTTGARQRLVNRAKLVLASDLARRWTLGEIGTEVHVSPVYLTQVFQQVEGIPLYRYQLRLRLARALDLLSQYNDLTELSLEVGFSSHSTSAQHSGRRMATHPPSFDNRPSGARCLLMSAISFLNGRDILMRLLRLLLAFENRS